MSDNDIEVDLDRENGTAVIRGKTNVPFTTLVTLILQRKVQTLLKTWKDEPVVVSSELLTSLASAPEDKTEDRGALIAVTLAVGIYAGVLLTTAVLLVLAVAGIVPGMAEYVIVCAVLLGFALLVLATQRMQKRATKRAKLVERMEKLAELLTK